jgi:catechol 2,3-dioxygenase-like lactoylglutathione lyase family enzyme
MEFACCEECNVGTKAADLIAACMARVTQFETPGDWRTPEFARYIQSAEQLVPGIKAEFLREGKFAHSWRTGPSGLFQKVVEVRADGPILSRHMTVFTAKMGMALYREHVGQPLPLDGAIFTKWFLNAGLSQESAEAMLAIMPIGGALRNGRKHSIEQFGYRYNCDERSIIAALVGFQSNLHLFLIAAAEPDTYASIFEADPHTVRVPVGGLAERLRDVDSIGSARV